MKVELKDIKQIEDGIYSFIKSIDIGGIPWCLEYFKDSKNTALCFKRNADVPMIEKYIGGGYKAEFNFSVLIQSSNRDTRAMLDLSRILYGVATALDREQGNGFPTLNLDDRIRPLEFEMTNVPAEYEGEGVKLSTFLAGFKFIYEKKGRFE